MLQPNYKIQHTTIEAIGGQKDAISVDLPRHPVCETASLP